MEWHLGLVYIHTGRINLNLIQSKQKGFVLVNRDLKSFLQLMLQAY